MQAGAAPPNANGGPNQDGNNPLNGQAPDDNEGPAPGAPQAPPADEDHMDENGATAKFQHENVADFEAINTNSQQLQQMGG